MNRLKKLLKGLFSTGTTTGDNLPRSSAPIDRAARVSSHLNNISFVLDESLDLSVNSAGRKLLLVNISTTGIGLHNYGLNWPPVETSLKGQIWIAGTPFNVEMQIKHKSETILGCQFIRPDLLLRKAISNFLKYEIAALDLARVSEEFFRQPEKGESFWFTDAGANELYLITEGGRLKEFSVLCLGFYLGSRGDGKAEVGYITNDEEDQDEALDVRRGMRIRFTRSYTEDVAEQAERFFDAIRELDPDLRKQLKTWIKDQLTPAKE